MRNPIKIIRKMSREWVAKGDIDFDFRYLERIIQEAELSFQKIQIRKKTYFKVEGIKAKTIFLSGKEDECKFAAISDLHGGFNSIEIRKLEKFLLRAEKSGVKYCLISGDTHEGINIFPGQELLLKEKYPEKQAEIIFNVLKKFNFKYVLIDGNHDLSFNTNGYKNPNEILARMLNKIGIQTHYLKTFVGNVIIGGVCIRLVHLDDHYGKGQNIPCLKYLEKVIEHPFVEFNGITYLVACIQAGHIHEHGCYDTIRYEYTNNTTRKRSRNEIDKLIEKIGYQPLMVLQPGTIKKHLIDERKEFGFIAKISTNKQGIPRSYKII